MGVVDVMMLGRLGKGHLAAFSVGNALFNIAWYFIEGFLTAQDTLASNAHGMGDEASVRQWTYISLLSTFFLCTVASIPFLFVEEILGQLFWMPYHLKTKASVHIYLLLPGLWFLAFSRVLQKYMQAQNIMTPGLTAGLIGNGINILCNYIFIYLFQFGFAGCGLATSIARLSMFVYMSLHVYRSHQWPTIYKELRGLGRDPAIERGFLGMSACIRRIKTIIIPRTYDYIAARDDSTDDGADDGDGIQLMTPGQQKAASAGGKRATRGAQLEDDELDVLRHSGLGKVKPSITPPKSSSNQRPSATKNPALKSSRNINDNSGDSVESDSDDSERDDGHEGEDTTLPPGVRRRRRLMFVRMVRFLLLGVPGGLMLGLESWIFVAMSIFVAQMGTIPLATHEVMAMFSMFVFLSLPFAIAIAATIRISHLLAEQNTSRAKGSAVLCLLMSFGVVCLCGVLVYYTPETLGSIFTDDPDIIYRLRRISPILAGFQVVYGIQGVAQGVLRAMGKQLQVAGFTLFCLWVVGLPTGLYMGFYVRPTFGFDGLWGGLLLGMGCLAISLLLSVALSDWEREGRRALVRADMKLPQQEIGQPRIGSLSKGGFPVHMYTLNEELDEMELVDITMVEQGRE